MASLFEFRIPAEYHLTLPNGMGADLDDDSYFSCKDECYVADEIVTWLKERTKSYSFVVPFEIGRRRDPKPFLLFISDAQIAVMFKLQFPFPCLEH